MDGNLVIHALNIVLFVRSVFFLLDSAPYGSEKAFGLLNAAVVSSKMYAAVGLYGDGVYLALAGQDSRDLLQPNHSDILYAYPEMRVLAHEPSLADRGLMSMELVERVELMDEEKFLEEMLQKDGIILL
ncbi:MAG: sulfur relay protein TusC [Methanosaeta sp. PtaU1.Bin112]|nr:MAG: sulfur relay protein TusC [Methanosaeta sp. PtaU1.Bin112]